MRSRSPLHHDRHVELFNQACPVGGRVRVAKDDGTTHDGKTTSEAYVLSGHTPVVHVSGIRGCYLLDRVTVMP